MISTVRRHSASAAQIAMALSVVASMPAPANAQSSPWSKSRDAEARLIDGGPAPADAGLPLGTQLAGVEIRLAPQWITYWRNPGDAGVPPTFDFSGSDNLRDARVLYPAPTRLDEAGSAAFGYRDAVIFPIEVMPSDASKPVTLDLKLGYAVCAEICLPARAEARLSLGAATPDETASVRQALLDVPAPRRIGEAGTPAIQSVTAAPDGKIEVEASAPAGAALFAEAPDPWYVTASPGRPLADGHVGFTLSPPNPSPGGPVPPGPLRLTLTSSAGAIEVSLPLDAAIRKP